jgi:hypothetical protein
VAVSLSQVNLESVILINSLDFFFGTTYKLVTLVVALLVLLALSVIFMVLFDTLIGLFVTFFTFSINTGALGGSL